MPLWVGLPLTNAPHAYRPEPLHLTHVPSRSFGCDKSYMPTSYCGVTGVWIANDGINTHEPCMIRPSGVRVNVPQPVIQLMTIIVVKSANSVTTTKSLTLLRRAIALA